MNLQSIKPARAKELMTQWAVLIDICKLNEFQREKIAPAKNLPLSKIAGETLSHENTGVIFTCKTGNRTGTPADRLSKVAGNSAYVLEGGLEGWKVADFPT